MCPPSVAERERAGGGLVLRGRAGWLAGARGRRGLGGGGQGGGEQLRGSRAQVRAE